MAIEALRYPAGPEVWFRCQLIQKIEMEYAKVLGCKPGDLNYAYWKCNHKKQKNCNGEPEWHSLVWCGHGLKNFIKRALRTPGVYELLVTSSKNKGGIRDGVDEIEDFSKVNTIWIGDVWSDRENMKNRYMMCGSTMWCWLWDSFRLGFKFEWDETGITEDNACGAVG